MLQRVLLFMLYFCSYIAAADVTVLKLYRPFGEVTEQVSPEVKSELKGSCWVQSRLIVREDAWRCRAQGKIYDPCFVKASGTAMEVLCPHSPWVSDSVQIRVKVSLNNAKHSSLDMSRAFPWAIELSNGEHCQAIDSEKDYDGMAVHYHCSDQNLLLGYLQRCKAQWSMLEKTPDGVKTVELSKVWF